ncbi:MAG: hypothetical protein IAI50_19180 [Candidatus Eremiobacteraeota bacterium]|nr:hypothetical protein [Candidatus Eremiobacteraeota bacterium]
MDDALAAAAVNGLTIRSAAAYLAEYFSARDIAAQDSDDAAKGSAAIESVAPLRQKQDQRSE